ncbi:glycosyl hydrolase [Opitutaceae bacterium TAV5]|nr:glycosyl hydrolase [Opitutaceae bacterium TAV5]
MIAGYLIMPATQNTVGLSNNGAVAFSVEPPPDAHQRAHAPPHAHTPVAGLRVPFGDGDVAAPPGRIISHIRPDIGQYVGSPSIAILPDGALVASHDLFGPGTSEHRSATTLVFRSEDRGETWRQVARIEPAFWSNLFVHDNGDGRGAALYLLGPTHHHGLLVIRRSDDGGHTWTEPRDTATGLLTPYGQYHTAPMPMLVHRGRIWRAIEDATAGTHWGRRYNPVLMSAPLGADLLRRDDWSFSEMYRQSPDWLGGRFGGWLEGNAVALPDGRIADILRVDYAPGGKAALVTLGDDGQSLEFSPETDFIDLPGGPTKFTLRRDPRSPEGAPVYWTLANAVPPRHACDKANHAAIRNTLALLRSADLRTWQLRHVPLWHPDSKRHAFQYVDWLFDGDDLVVASRTAWDDRHGGAPNEHDANFLTFHRIRDFRTRTMVNSPVDPFAGT